jgi:Na+/melibiose symporter-like transporter
MNRIAVVTLTLVVAAPVSALACPVCGLAGPGDNGWAYAAMSAILSALPLGMIAGTVFWLHRRASAHEAQVLAPLPTESTHVPEHQDAVQLRPTRD